MSALLLLLLLIGYEGPTLASRSRSPGRPPRAPASGDHGPFSELYLSQHLEHGQTMMVEELPPFNATTRDGEQRIVSDTPMVERRSIPQFGGMVTLYTRTSPIRLLYYGNWCGSGGMGATLDKIDQCCMVHDNCYGEAEQPPCHLPLRKPYVIHYSWSWDEKHKRAYCLNTSDHCARRTCECDRTAAECFSQFMIDSKLEWSRLRKNRISKGTKRPSVEDFRPYRH